jgi:hypothetical protein
MEYIKTIGRFACSEPAVLSLPKKGFVHCEKFGPFVCCKLVNWKDVGFKQEVRILKNFYHTGKPFFISNDTDGDGSTYHKTLSAAKTAIRYWNATKSTARYKWEIVSLPVSEGNDCEQVCRRFTI